MIFVFLCPTSLSMTISRTIRVAANGVISFFFMMSNIPCIYVPHLLYLFISGHLGCFHVLAIVKNCNDIRVHVSF